jgi:radical SAM superfamily enzyme YgiQ (UPF0313 family)
MKVALIAMSGIRAENEELMKLGMILPGFLERAKTLFAMPSLSLLTLAALTPNDVDVVYREYRELPPEELLDCDLVAISSFSAQISDAYCLADRYRQRGTTVVLGGLHVTVLPDEAQRHADAIVIGEGEPAWPVVLSDFKKNALKPRYTQEGSERFDLASAPVPRYELLEHEKYNRFPVQTVRGCPFKCDFCASSILLTPLYRHKPADRVVREIREIKRLWPHPFIELADDNTFSNRGKGRELAEAIGAENVKWFAETDISIAQDDELLHLISESGCRQVLIGLESPAGRRP